jgi:hypothetical protein
VTPFESPGTITTEILARFMRGELDAKGAARELRAAFPYGAETEYVLWPRGTWTEALVQAKKAELASALDEVRFVQATEVARDLPVRAFPFRAADFAERAEVARRRMLPGLRPLMIVALGLLPAAFLARALAGRYLAPFVLTLIIVFSGVAFVLGVRDQWRIRADGLVCPSCGVGLVGTKRFGGRVDLEVMRTGRCPQCRTRLIPPDEVESPSRGVR